MKELDIELRATRDELERAEAKIRTREGEIERLKQRQKDLEALAYAVRCNYAACPTAVQAGLECLKRTGEVKS